MTTDVILSSISELDANQKVVSSDLFLMTTKDNRGAYVSKSVNYDTLSGGIGLKSAAFHENSEYATYYHRHDDVYSSVNHLHDEVYSRLDHKHSEYLSAVPSAKDNVTGGFKTGYKSEEYNYGVQLDEDGKAFVNVPLRKSQDHVFMSKQQYNDLTEEEKMNPDVVYCISDDVQEEPECVSYVIDSWHEDNGYRWYRVYSDGFCEQGGVGEMLIPKDEGRINQSITISLMKDYVNTFYHVIVSNANGTNVIGGNHPCEILGHPNNTESITVICDHIADDLTADKRFNFYWETKGWLR